MEMGEKAQREHTQQMFVALNHTFIFISPLPCLPTGVSVCQLITECTSSSPCLCRPCGESPGFKIKLQLCLFQQQLYFSRVFFFSIHHPLLWLHSPHRRSALQSLHKACEVARCHNYFPGSLFLTWVSYYQSRVSSDQALINEWNAMQDLQSHRADSPVLFSDV